MFCLFLLGVCATGNDLDRALNQDPRCASLIQDLNSAFSVFIDEKNQCYGRSKAVYQSCISLRRTLCGMQQTQLNNICNTSFNTSLARARSAARSQCAEALKRPLVSEPKCFGTDGIERPCPLDAPASDDSVKCYGSDGVESPCSHDVQPGNQRQKCRDSDGTVHPCSDQSTEGGSRGAR